MDQQQSQQRMSRLDTVEAGAPQSSSIIEQALENVSSDEEDDERDNLDDGLNLGGPGGGNTPAIEAPHHFEGVEFEFNDEDFFDDLPPIVSDRPETSTITKDRELEIIEE